MRVLVDDDKSQLAEVLRLRIAFSFYFEDQSCAVNDRLDFPVENRLEEPVSQRNCGN